MSDFMYFERIIPEDTVLWHHQEGDDSDGVGYDYYLLKVERKRKDGRK